MSACRRILVWPPSPVCVFSTSSNDDDRERRKTERSQRAEMGARKTGCVLTLRGYDLHALHTVNHDATRQSTVRSSSFAASQSTYRISRFSTIDHFPNHQFLSRSMRAEVDTDRQWSGRVDEAPRKIAMDRQSRMLDIFDASNIPRPILFSPSTLILLRLRFLNVQHSGQWTVISLR